MAAMIQLLAFQRHTGENSIAVLARYAMVRQRAFREGNFVMSWEGCSLQVLRALNVNSQQLIQFLQPFGSRLPQDENEFYMLTGHMRRVGHILEHAPNNFGQLLHGNRQARRGEDLVEPQDPAGSSPPAYMNLPGDPQVNGEGVMWGNPTAPAPEWQGWQPAFTTQTDGWGQPGNA